MSRSAWKPNFVTPSLVSSLQKSGLSTAHICFQRSSILLAPRVGARLLVWNGNRFYPITVTDERVGHRMGEFAPTRKRPPLTAKVASKKGQKLYFKNLWDKKHIQLVFASDSIVSGLLLDLPQMSLLIRLGILLLFQSVVGSFAAIERISYALFSADSQTQSSPVLAQPQNQQAHREIQNRAPIHLVLLPHLCLLTSKLLSAQVVLFLLFFSIASFRVLRSKMLFPFPNKTPIQSFRSNPLDAFSSYRKLDVLFDSPTTSVSVDFKPNSNAAPAQFPLSFVSARPAANTSSSAQMQPVSRELRRALRTLPAHHSAAATALQTPGIGFVRTNTYFRRSTTEAAPRQSVRTVVRYVPTALAGSFEDAVSFAGFSQGASEIKHRFSLGWQNGFTASTARSPLTDLQLLLGFFFSAPVHFTAVNSFALSSFAFNRERRRSSKNTKSTARKAGPSIKTTNLFLQQIETERASRFQRAAIRIPDLVRLSFVTVYLKKPQTLAGLFATSLANLPRNRKETQFLRFLRKLVKVFAAQRKERRGVRLRFQGRVNRWRRTKHRQTERGKLNLFTYTTRLEYGSAQAITRKGAIGVRLWFCYHASWGKGYRSALFSFVRSQISQT